jgi:predicted nucleic acid-binding protein
MPDFYVGAHALIAGMELLTRDAKRYRSYFPALKVIAPWPDPLATLQHCKDAMAS